MNDGLAPEAPVIISDTPPEEFLVPDIIELVRKGTHFTELRDGIIHVVSALTGHAIALMENIHNVPTRWRKRENFDGTITWVQEGLDSADRPAGRVLLFSPLIIDQMCSMMVEGDPHSDPPGRAIGITRICGRPGFPSYNEFCRWKRQHPWIHEMIEQARKDRAERLRDEAIEIADTAISAKDAPAKALRVEIRKWSAGVDNERYNPKTKVDAQINIPTQIIVQTGIERPAQPAPAPLLGAPGSPPGLPAPEGE